MIAPMSASAQSRERVRKWWRDNEKHAVAIGFSRSVINNIIDDHEDCKACWCCGAYGYQERAHIKAASLGGSNKAGNLFLLCDECHIASPDHKDFKWFVSWVNDNEGRARNLNTSIIDDILGRFIDMYGRSNPDIVEAFQCAMSENIKLQIGSSTQHGANTSPSTIRASLFSAFEQTMAQIPPQINTVNIEMQLDLSI